jgi:hypothetical protein
VPIECCWRSKLRPRQQGAGQEIIPKDDYIYTASLSVKDQKIRYLFLFVLVREDHYSFLAKPILKPDPMPKPDLQQVPEHLRDEINLVECDHLQEAFVQYANHYAWLQSIPPEKWMYRYAENKWTIKEVVQHVIDAERIWCHRALVIVRKDSTTPLVSFEEKDYAEHSNANSRNEEDLIDELRVVQWSSKKLFDSFNQEQVNTVGRINDYTIDVNAIGFVVIGHFLHHLKIIKERYL